MENDNRNNMAAAFAATNDCVPIGELTLILEGQRGEDSRRQAEAHTATCLHCRTELALLREFESPEVRPEERRDVNWIVARLRRNSPVAPIPFWKQIWAMRVLTPASVALATALLAIGIGLYMRQTPISVPAPGREVMRSQSVDIIAPLGDLTTTPTELKWRDVSGASSYRVRLLEVDRTELWATTVSQTSVALPGGVREKILPLKTIFWEITALNGSGESLASSGLKSFRVK